MPVLYPYVIQEHVGRRTGPPIEVKRGRVILFNRPNIGETVILNDVEYKVVDVRHRKEEDLQLVLERKPLE